MWRWHIVIESWPHSTGKGQAADQEAAGDRVQSYYVNAEDISEAMRMASCIADGMRANPMVWRAPITGITRVRE